MIGCAIKKERRKEKKRKVTIMQRRECCNTAFDWVSRRFSNAIVEYKRMYRWCGRWYSEGDQEENGMDKSGKTRPIPGSWTQPATLYVEGASQYAVASS